MKNKVLIFVALAVTSLSLTACNLLPFFNQEEGGYSYRNIGESGNKQGYCAWERRACAGDTSRKRRHSVRHVLFGNDR